MTINGDAIKPAGKRIQAKTGEPIVFKIKSDRDGELHVHSTPGQTPAYTTGETTITLTIDKPGLIDVEDHESDIVIVQLEVR